MYTYKGTVYSDAGHVLQSRIDGTISFQGEGDMADYEELGLNLDSVTRTNGIIIISDGLIAAIECDDYAECKAEWIKKRYTYDDQIALMLNKDNSDMAMELYIKMQQWRTFSAKIAHIIVIDKVT